MTYDRNRRATENAMAFIPLPAGIRVAVEYTLDGKPVVNIYHISDDNPITQIRLDLVAAIFVNWWDTYLYLRMSNQIALVSVTATDVSVANGGQSIDAPVSPIPGDGVLAAATSQTALVVSLRTPKTGRSFRGRSYLAGLTRSEFTDNDVTTTFATNVAADFLELISDLNTNNFNLIVASYQEDGAPRTTGVATNVTTLIVNTRVDTQRRRIPKF